MKHRSLCILAALALILPLFSACAPHVHSYGEAWSHDETHHYKRAICEHSDLIANKGEHTLADGICTVCGYLSSPEDTPEDAPEDTPEDVPEDVPECAPDVGHSFSERVCTVCGALAPSEGLDIRRTGSKLGLTVYGIGTCRDKNVVIPATYEGEPVIAIAIGAFTDCDFVDSVTVPRSVTHVGFSANGFPDPTFAGHITVLCEAKERPEDWGERWNPSFSPVIWDYKNNDIAEDGHAYVTVDGLKYGVNIEEGTAFLIKQSPTVAGAIEIRESFLYKGRAVTVTKLRMSAFANCLALTSVRIGDSVTEVEFSAFSNSPSLTVYCEAKERPEGWHKNWNMSANCPIVWDCENSDVAENGIVYTVKDGVRYGIKDGVAVVRHQPNNITSVVLPAAITYRGAEYPVEEIAPAAFEGCSLLEEITIGLSVTRMGYSVFTGCPLVTIYCEATEAPEGWQKGWNPAGRPVVWGYTGE